MAFAESIGMALRGVRPGLERRREARTQGLGTALSLAQRGADIKRGERYRAEDMADRERARNLEILRIRQQRTEALKQQAQTRLQNSEDYQEALASGNYDAATRWENAVYSALWDRLPEEDKTSELSPFKLAELRGMGGMDISLSDVGAPSTELAGTQRSDPASVGLGVDVGGFQRRGLGSGFIVDREENTPAWLTGLFDNY